MDESTKEYLHACGEAGDLRYRDGRLYNDASGEVIHLLDPEEEGDALKVASVDFAGDQRAEVMDYMTRVGAWKESMGDRTLEFRAIMLPEEEIVYYFARTVTVDSNMNLIVLTEWTFQGFERGHVLPRLGQTIKDIEAGTSWLYDGLVHTFIETDCTPLTLVKDEEPQQLSAAQLKLIRQIHVRGHVRISDTHLLDDRWNRARKLCRIVPLVGDR